MPIIKTYESRNIPNLPYAIFFFDESPACNTVTVICVIKNLRNEENSQGDVWTIWHLDALRSSIYDVAIDLEKEEPIYDTHGISWTYDTFDEVLEELCSYDLDEVQEMVGEVRYFFS